MLSATSHPTSRKRFGTFTLRARLIVDPAVRIVDAVMVEKKTVVPWMVEPVRVETVMVEPVRVEKAARFILMDDPTVIDEALTVGKE
jgi:hypothetical protein